MENNCVIGPWRQLTPEDKDGRALLVEVLTVTGRELHIVRYMEPPADLAELGPRWYFDGVYSYADDFAFNRVADVRDDCVTTWPERALHSVRAAMVNRYVSPYVLEVENKELRCEIKELQKENMQLMDRMVSLDIHITETEVDVLRRSVGNLLLRVAQLEDDLESATDERAAAGPWREPTKEDMDVLHRCERQEELEADPKLMLHLGPNGTVLLVATVRLPEENS